MMAKRERDKLYNIDKSRLHEIFYIIDHVRGSYSDEIEKKLDEIEDLVAELVDEESEE